MSWFSKALKSAGKGVSAGLKGVSSGANFVAKQAGKVPVVGAGLKGVFDITLSAPLQLTSNVAKGQRLDRAGMTFLKDNVKGVKAVAPYAQMVVGAIPGIGTLPSMAIAGALALSQGQPITAALIEGVKGAIPGGKLAQSAFSITTSAIQGKPLDKIALDALPLSAEQKKAIATTIAATKDIAAGKRVDTALLNAGNKQLPLEVQKAVNIAVAVAHGANLQKVASSALSPDLLSSLGTTGIAIIKSNPVFLEGAKLVAPANRKAYETALGLMNNKLTPIQLQAVRSSFKGKQLEAFDLAVSAHIGMTSSPKGKTPAETFGYAAAKGMAGQTLKNKESLLKVVVTNPAAAAGVKTVVKENSSLWQRLLKYIGFSP
jgi:hypothetical protein